MIPIMYPLLTPQNVDLVCVKAFCAQLAAGGTLDNHTNYCPSAGMLPDVVPGLDQVVLLLS